MMDRTATCCFHPSRIFSMSFGPIPLTCDRNVGDLSITSSVFSPNTSTMRFANLGPTPETRFQSTPLVIDGVLYTTGGSRRAVTALDAATGEQLWVYSLNEGERGAEAPRRLSGRGLAFWQRGEDRRVVYVTPGYQLVAVNADTGRPVESFGKSGVVDLRDGLEQGDDWDPNQIGTNSPPTVVGDVVIVGSSIADLLRRVGPPGDVRGYDARTGALVWTFHTIPEPGEPGAETWGKNGREHAGHANVWSTITADLERGLVFLPVSTASPDFDGADRPGDNLFSDSVVALRAATGERVWHFPDRAP